MNAARRRSWLLLGGELSGYTFDLFDTVASVGGIDVRFLYNPIDGLASFQHEQTEGRAKNQLRWKDAGWSEIRDFVRSPRPDVVFVYGNRPRLKLNLALGHVPSSVPLYYAADSNIVALAQRPRLALGRALAGLPIVHRATAALSLGLTNQLALEALGFARTVELPVYAVDFASLDAEAGKGPRPAVRKDDRIVVLIIARMIPVKNLPAFVEAVANASDVARRVRLLVAGDGPDRNTLEDLQRGNPSLEMELLGPIPRHRIGALFPHADVLVLPSLEEPWGIVVVEALGMGVPVVATPAVGSAVSLGGYSGAIRLSESKAAESVVLALRSFIEDRDQLTNAARSTKSFIRSRFDRPVVAERMIRLVYPTWQAPRNFEC